MKALQCRFKVLLKEQHKKLSFILYCKSFKEHKLMKGPPLIGIYIYIYIYMGAPINTSVILKGSYKGFCLRSLQTFL